MDVAFLLDSSRTAGVSGYLAQKRFVGLFSDEIDISSSGSRVGVISYSSQARIDVAFGDYSNFAGLQLALADLKFMDGRPRIDAAFNTAFVDLFTFNGKVRRGVPRVVVLLTAGKATNVTDYETLRFAAEPYKEEGITVIAVGIGPSADLQRLRVLVDSDELVLAASSFETLRDLALNLTLLACKSAEPRRVIHPMDVAFLIDTSDKISRTNFEREKHFIKTLVRSVVFSSNLTRVSVISYGNESDLAVDFSDQQSTGSLIERVDSIPFLGGHPQIDRALEMAAAHLFSSYGSARADSPKTVVIVTDCDQDTIAGENQFDESAEVLRKEGVKVLVVAVGCEKEDHKRELQTFVEGADDIFTPDSFETLAAAAEKVSATAGVYAAPENCTKTADVAFIVQSSDSIGISNYQIQKDFIKAIAGSFGIRPKGSRAGVIVSGNDTTVNIKFSDHIYEDELKLAVDRLPNVQGTGKLDHSLQVVLSQLLVSQGGARPGVAKILLVLTGGKHTDNEGMLNVYTTKLRELGVKMIAIGIGDKADDKVLTSLGESVFLESSYESLMMKTRQLARVACDNAGFSRCTYPADIGFLVDSSGSLNKEGFNKQKDFVEDLAERLDISPVDSLIGVVTYSDKASVEIKFSDYEYQEDLIKAIEALQYKGRTTRIDKAINMATRELMSSRGGRREKIPAIMVILTDGRQSLDSDTKPLEEATANMLKLGIKTLVVGIGELADKNVLRKMAKRDEDVFMATSLSVLPNVVQPVVASICQAAAPPPCAVPLDVVFLLESSDNISPSAFQGVKGFMKDTIRYLLTTIEDQRVGVILYSSEARNEIAFGQFSSEFGFNEAIDKLPLEKGQPRLDLALNIAEKVFADSEDTRAGVQKVCIVLSNVKKSSYRDSKVLKQAAEPLHKAGVRVIAIGATSSAGRNQLRALTEHPADVIRSSSCDGLESKFSFLFQRICYGAGYEQCDGIAEIIFAVHSPKNLGPSNYRKEKEFVKSVAKTFDFASGKTRVGLILYSNFATVRAGIGAKTTLNAFENLVDGLPHEQGETRMDRALKLASSLFDPSASGAMRRGVPRVLILIASGKQTIATDSMNLEDAARPLHEADVRILVVGVGQNVDGNELRTVGLKEEDVFLAPSFEDLVSLSGSVSKTTCEAAKPPICAEPLDVVFLIDSSGSVGVADFEKQKAFLKAAAGTLDIESGLVHAGSLVYSDVATVHQPFAKCNGTKSVIRAFDDVPYYGRSTRIDRALSLANTAMFSDSGGCRPYVAKALVLLTDGRQTPAPDSISLERAVRPLRSKKVARLAVGIGNKISAAELGKVVDEEDDIMIVDSYDDLPSSLHLLSEKICASAALKKCEVPVDIAFLLDSSASLGERGYQKMKDFVKAVANTFEIGPTTTCAGVIIYGTDAITAVRFADASNNVIFNAAVDTMPYLRGETRIDKALHLAHSELLSHRRGARKGVAKVVIVLTDGRQSQVPSRVDIQNAIAPLLSAGIRVFAVGVGEEVEKDELQLLVEKKEDAISVPSYDLLMEHTRALSIATCESSDIDACENTVDVAFLLDSSGSLTPSEFQQSKDFVAKITRSFLMNEVGSRVGLIQFSIVPTVNARLSDGLSFEDFQGVLDQVRYQGGFTRLDRALSMAAEKLFSKENARNHIPKVLIVLSDGVNTDAPDAVSFDTAVAPLHRAGVRVIAVATGNAKGRENLYFLTQRKEDLYDVKNFDDLALQQRRISKETCESAALSRCERVMDVSFIVDASESVGLQNYHKLLEFVRKLATALEMSQIGSHASLVIFSDTARVQIKLNEHDDIREFNKALKEAPYLGKRTRIDKALRLAAAGVFNSRAGMRPGVRRVAVLLTEGRQTRTFDSIPLRYAAEPLRLKRVNVFAVGIGSDVRYDELRSAANRDQNVFQVKTFQGLNEIAEELSKNMCRG